MAKLSPYRALSPEKRLALVTHKIASSREARALYVQRLIARKAGGFRAVTIQSWPVEQLAREVVRSRAESGEDELDLLHLLYVQLEPAIQVTFLDAAGVAHDNGNIADELEVPYSDAAGVERGVAAVRATHGDDGLHYLRTLARYSRPAWPGIETLVDEG
ncbi:MAG: hypothetical protein IPF47_00060 [Gemmatimonadetes bacterium]|jgi:hypothetical protein|nr:hypothetical protein [Gemmatimonadota bacterium]